MIINHTHKFIFLHIPKTAGTSVTDYLSQFTGWNDIEIGGTHYGEQFQAIYQPRFKLDKHSPAQRIKAIVGDEIWHGYRKFAVVRHPLDRLVSAYHFYLQWSHPTAAPVLEFSGFEEFVYSDYLKKDAQNPSRPAGLQSAFLKTGDAELDVDDLCRFENLGTDIAAVAGRIGLPRAKLPVLNRSTRGNYRSYLTQDMTEYLANLYRPDFELLGYSAA